MSLLQQALKHENDLDTDNLFRLEMTKKGLFKTTEEIHYLSHKEEDLHKQLKEQKVLLKELEDRVE